MSRSIVMIGLAVAIVVAGVIAWSNKSGNVGTVSASRDAGAPPIAVEHLEPVDAGTAFEFALASLDAALKFPQLMPEPDEDLTASRLPMSSPKMVRFGVIVVQYRGAQAAAPSTRSKDEASKLARSIAEAAKGDFKAQVSKGDSGSMEDAGLIPRGVLEPTVEYGLFTLRPGQVSDPIDTPRGFWIVRRIE
jgi:hypothetical protein